MKLHVEAILAAVVIALTLLSHGFVPFGKMAMNLWYPLILLGLIYCGVFIGTGILVLVMLFDRDFGLSGYRTVFGESLVGLSKNPRIWLETGMILLYVFYCGVPAHFHIVVLLSLSVFPATAILYKAGPFSRIHASFGSKDDYSPEWTLFSRREETDFDRSLSDIGHTRSSWEKAGLNLKQDQNVRQGRAPWDDGGKDSDVLDDWD